MPETVNPASEFCTVCKPCGRKMFWATRPANEDGPAAQIPLDPSAPTFLVVRHRADPSKLACMSGKTLRGKLDKIVLKDGTEIDGSRVIGLFTSHFATCKKVAVVKHQQRRAAAQIG